MSLKNRSIAVTASFLFLGVCLLAVLKCSCNRPMMAGHIRMMSLHLIIMDTSSRVFEITISTGENELTHCFVTQPLIDIFDENAPYRKLSYCAMSTRFPRQNIMNEKWLTISNFDDGQSIQMSIADLMRFEANEVVVSMKPGNDKERTTWSVLVKSTSKKKAAWISNGPGKGEYPDKELAADIRISVKDLIGKKEILGDWENEREIEDFSFLGRAQKKE